LVSCLFLEDFPEEPSIAELEQCVAKNSAAGGYAAICTLAWGDGGVQPGERQNLLESSRVRQ